VSPFGAEWCTPPYVAAVASELEREQRFGSEEPFSQGVEEELCLVEPIIGRQVNSSAAVLELGDVSATVERELHTRQLELITGVQEDCEGRGPRACRDAWRGCPDRSRAARLGHASAR
jgi:hypothetical protein